MNHEPGYVSEQSISGPFVLLLHIHILDSNTLIRYSQSLDTVDYQDYTDACIKYDTSHDSFPSSPSCAWHHVYC
jgi:hypothetical protein